MKVNWRYWGWFAAKAAGVTSLMGAIYAALRNTWFRAEVRNGWFDLSHTTFDGVLFGFWMLPMLWIALLWLCWNDQRYRCRTCARKLRMPLDYGSYSALLLNHPGVEYVCPYGHGKLQEQVWLATESKPKWTRHGSLWQELFKQ